MMERLKTWARVLRRNIVVLVLAARDRRVPRIAKIVAASVAAYALSPIDLVPDFIPVLGYLDDLVLLPAGIWLALRLIPDDLLAELRVRAAGVTRRPGANRRAALVVVAVWLSLAGILGVAILG